CPVGLSSRSLHLRRRARSSVRSPSAFTGRSHGPTRLDAGCPPCSYLLDLGLFGSQDLVDLLDETVRQLLHPGRALVMIVLADLAVLVELLEEVHALAPDIADGYPGLLRVLVRDLDELLAPLGVEGRNRHPEQRALHDRVQAQIGLADRLL